MTDAPQFTIVFRKSAVKDLARCEDSMKRRISSAIDCLSSEPQPSGVVKLEGFANFWRIRVGAFRVIYEIQANQLIIHIVHIAHRKDVYRSL
ncbi:MAG: type II toxin-antitoxin system RelE/ParE family toxin [Synergistaceae bacterium]|nr:type II toxin-antitoxin system RelE/ParE family toxin [Synergistaceae bacterium]